jgi:hypothetical protein
MNTQITCKILALTNLYSLIHNAGKRSEEDMYTKIYHTGNENKSTSLFFC